MTQLVILVSFSGVAKVLYTCNANDRVSVLFEKVFADLPPVMREQGRLSYVLCKSDGTLLTGESIIGEVLEDGDELRVNSRQETVLAIPLPAVDPSANIMEKTQQKMRRKLVSCCNVMFSNSRLASDSSGSNSDTSLQSSFLRQRKVNK